MTFSITFSEILFIANSIYCIYLTYKHLEDPIKSHQELSDSVHKQNMPTPLKVLFYLFLHTVFIFWGLNHSESNLSFFNFLGSQVLNAVIIYQVINKTLLARSKHYYLAEIWSTVSWVLISCEIIVKGPLFN